MRFFPILAFAIGRTGHFTFRARVLTSAACLLALASAPTAQEASAPPPPTAATVVQRVDEYMQAEMRVNGFSGTILVARKGTPIVANGYGLANAE